MVNQGQKQGLIQSLILVQGKTNLNHHLILKNSLLVIVLFFMSSFIPPFISNFTCLANARPCINSDAGVK